jgi:hypothetical protein
MREYVLTARKAHKLVVIRLVLAARPVVIRAYTESNLGIGCAGR